MRDRSLARFVLFVIAWLVLTLPIWWFAAPLLAWPVTLLAEAVTRSGFGDLVKSVEQHGDLITFVTSLKPAQSLAATSAVVLDEVDVRRYSFGLPLLAALILAARQKHMPRNLLLAFAVMLPFECWGVVAELLQDLASGLGPAIASQTGFSALQREAIAFAYQFGSLILPTVAPIVFWVLTHRRFVEGMAGRGAT